ncbi:MAG: ECF transporter S component [Clostridia bacterium]|nr:ECF transporter S component [Clostridia bacterium]
MQTRKDKRAKTEQLTLMALLTALVAVLSYLGGFIQIGGIASVNLSLIPVVVGATIFGPASGAWLGLVSAIGVLLAPATAVFFEVTILGTVVVVIIKGVLSGFCAGLAYKLIEKLNRYVAVVVSSIVCPVVNTGIYIIGCFLFFADTVSEWASAKGSSFVAYLFLSMVGLNFVFELLANILLSPSVYSLLNIRKKTK